MLCARARPPSSFCQPLIGWRGGRRRLETKRVDRIGCHSSSVLRRRVVRPLSARSIIAAEGTNERRHHRVISPHHISCSCIHPSSPIHPFFPAIYRTFEVRTYHHHQSARGRGDWVSLCAISVPSQNKLNSFFRRFSRVEIYVLSSPPPPPSSSLSWPRFAITLGCCSFAHARCHLITISLFAFRLRWRWVRTRARRACVPPAHGIEGEGGRRCGRVTIERSFDVMAPPPFLPRKLRLYCA